MDSIQMISAQIQKLHLEISTLTQENTMLRENKARKFSFMEPVIGENQRRFGFMTGADTMQPVNTPESLRKKYDFMV